MDTDEKGSNDVGHVDTGGGALIDGDVDVEGGEFVGRDKIVQGDEVRGDKVLGDKVEAERYIKAGTYIEQVLVTRAEVQDIEDLEPEPGDAPYKGLQYFTEQDADLFFGRERLTARIVNRLRDTQFLAVVGASGSGKSSLVRAGVIPALRSGKQLVDDSFPPTGSGNWSIHTIKPKATPLQSLADSLTRDQEDVRSGKKLREQLAQDLEVFHLAARKHLARQAAEHLLLVIDQFEELFTLCKDEAVRRAFVDNLLTAVAAETNAPVTVIITLRADFYTECGNYDGLRQVLSQHQEYIGAMSRDEMFDAIVKPAARSGEWKFQKGLVELMLDEIGSEPGALSLLSHALLETWKQRRGHIMTLSGYTEAGGVRGAIARTAEAVYERQLTETQQAVARGIFLRLTELGEGAQDTRRRATANELRSSSPNPDEVDGVLKVLVAARLIVTDQDSATGEEVVEVAHEALIRHWWRLRDWLDEDRQLLRLRQGVRRATDDWKAHEEDDSYLVHRDERLSQVTVLLTHTRVTLDDTERAYLEACQQMGYLAKASTAKSGWGVIFAHNADPAIRYALRELLDHRREQATKEHPRYYHEFTGPDGYRPGETGRRFLARHGVGASLPTPDKMPLYLLIVGDPETIPFSFQYQLDMQYAVGRIHFDTLDEYAQYARSVVAAETGDLSLSNHAAIFATQNPGDRATDLTLRHLATPIADHLEESKPEWTIARVFAEEATKARLGQLLGGEETSSLLFACSHGMEFPLGNERQLSDQGALLCQDWTGPNEWRGEITKDLYFAADDVSPDAQLLGSIFYLWGCYGAATPKQDNFSQQSFRGDTRQIAPHAFLARLPQRLLSHPKGGALAVIGSVERKWNYSFMAERGVEDIDAFLTTLQQLMKGYPVGVAMEYFNQRYAALMVDLIALIERSQFGEVDPYELAQAWTATNDARNYIIVGDPAVRLKVVKRDEPERPTIEAGLRLEPTEAALQAEIERAAAAWEAEGRPEGALQHRGEGLAQIESYGTLFMQDESRRTYIRACQLDREIQEAAATWEESGRPTDGLAHLGERLSDVEATGLVLQAEPALAYLATCRAEEAKRQSEVEWLHQGDELCSLIAEQGLEAVYQAAAAEGAASAEERESLAAGGWGVIFAHDADPAIREALQPLLDHRQPQAAGQDERHFHEFGGFEGYRPGESGVAFLYRHGADVQGALAAEKVPYYLLIVGSPETIPFEFQYQLAQQYAVGRIHFDTAEEYAQYAQSVVRAETTPGTGSRRLALFAPQHPDDQATKTAQAELISPLLEQLTQALPEWSIETVLKEDATKARLGRLLGAADTPALLFCASHGQEYPKDHADQRRYQGAIVCQDWPGREAPSASMVFSGDDVAQDADLSGLVAFLFGGFSAGMPESEDFAFAQGRQPKPQASQPFLTYLPRRLLAHPGGGALAVIGHVDRAWAASFAGTWGESGVSLFRDTLVQLAQGVPVGAAMEAFNRRYARLAVELARRQEQNADAAVEQRDVQALQIATVDARNYIIVGDPAVRVRTAAT